MALIAGRLLDQVLGHQGTIQKLLSLIATQRVPHSLLFAGPASQGKRLIALGFAQALLCERSPVACGQCPSCARVAAQQSEGLLVIQPEKGQIKIEAARAAVNQLALSSWNRARVVLIDDAHLLNPQAANALLKSIEEPPPNTYFILITPSQESVLKTIRSRSQVVRFRQLQRDELAQLDRAPVDPETRASALLIWQSLMSGRSLEAVDQARERLDSRERAQQVSQFWLEFVRDQWFQKKGLAPLTHGDLAGDLQPFSQLEDHHLSKLSESILNLERDLATNSEMQLSVESFLRTTGAPI
jgi:DNA polymerase-3 subunit delta'